VRSLREIIPGILIALVSVGLILGSLSLAFSEDNPALAPSPTPSQPPSATAPALASPIPASPIPTILPSLTFTVTLSISSPTATITAFPPTLAATITACAPPSGWVRNYIVQTGDTLFRISGLYGISAVQLQRGNCLNSTIIVPGQRLWVPNVATRTFTASPTGPASATPSLTGTPSPSNTPAPDTDTPGPTNTAPPTESPTPFPRTDTPTATP